ncbi:MAG: outer membrane beta-barrel domain-containing protein [Deltaproteobacteria bacterium]|nr:outer membrane beta-barrel domain-containing protein [Deltaproteobacteria bacterium]
MKRIFSLLFILSVCTASVGAEARETAHQELSSLGVQNRAYSLRHEFTGWVGTIPLDAFKKGLTFTGAYTLHFNDVLAWEVGQFTYSYRIETELNEDLENLVQPAAPTPFEVVQYFATSSFVFKPIYMKMAVLNSRVVYGELFLLAGGGYGKMTITKRPVVDYGGGARVYIGKYFSVRLDVRNYMFLNKDDVNNELWVALGASIGFK